MSGDIHSQIISELWALPRKKLFPQNDILIHWSHTNTTLQVLKTKKEKNRHNHKWSLCSGGGPQADL